MKSFTRTLLLLIGLVSFLTVTVNGQSIINPTDSVVTYVSTAAAGSIANPNMPANGVIAKWVRTVRQSWDTKKWKCYIINGIPFRIIFPNNYTTAADGKKYPLLLFYHGAGESGPARDNELSLTNGGTFFTNSVTNGLFNGFIIVPQTPLSGWDVSHLDDMAFVIKYMIANNKLDPFKISVNGLSAGGGATWMWTTRYPNYLASSLPMSANNLGNTDPNNINIFKFTRIWYFQGGKDTSPDPYTSWQVYTAVTAAGANYRYTIYPTLGHGTWNTVWAEPNFWGFQDSSYQSNPYTLFGQTEFCPGVAINVTIGVAPKMDGYQWRKDSTVISGATTNTINVTTVGSYSARVLSNGVWSDWSRIPVNIKVKQPTVTPTPTVQGLASNVIPAPDNNGVTIGVPANYASYTWVKASDTTTILSTTNTLNVTVPANYKVKVTEQYGCSSSFSAPFTVEDANGPNKPDPATSVIASATSNTTILLNWSQNPSPAFNETAFEIYQGTQAGGPYKLVKISAADNSKDSITGLTAGTKYYYIIRAVNGTSAAAVSNEASAKTIADVQPPTAPANLVMTAQSSTSVGLSWGASTDNVAVTGYDIYVNGTKAYSVPNTQTSFTVYSLTRGQNYLFTIKATDAAGNSSPASNQLSAQALFSGFDYWYYTIPTNSTKLPNFTTLTPASSGHQAALSLTITPAAAASYTAMLWKGYLNITTAGTYYLRTTSDDGSKLWLGNLNDTVWPYSYSGTATVSNDALQGATSVNSAALNLQVGVYPITIAYFNGTGGTSMAISWRTPASGTSYVTIPTANLTEASNLSGNAPNAPSNLVVLPQAYNKINLNWTDSSTNESGFEVYRSTAGPTTGFNIIGTTGAAVTTYVDSTVAANTKYYYQVRSINQYGASAFAGQYLEARWAFNGNYTDTTGRGFTGTASGTPTFDLSDKKEGTASIKFNGSQGVNIPASNGAGITNFLQEAYAQRTIAFWVKNGTKGTNKVVADIGGSDDGIAVLLNNDQLIAAVASNNVRYNISTTITSTNWNHVAVVYNGDSLLLYVNGVLAASNTSMSFHALTTTTNAHRLAQTNGTNAYNTTGSGLIGWIDDFSVYNTALNKEVITTIMNNSFRPSNGTSLPLPTVPKAAGGLAATATGAYSININWTDSATNETSYQLYRSNNTNSSYFLLATLPANTVSYSDTGLFANAKYYYKVVAVNPGGSSAASNENYATTKGVPPVIVKLNANQQILYNQASQIKFSATTVFSTPLSFSAVNLPSFATLVNNGNNTGSVNFSAPGAFGVYPNISVIATDAFGAADTTTFTLNVNNNYAPTLDTLVNYTMNEGDSLVIALNGANVNASDVLTVSVNGLSVPFTLVPTGNGKATLTIKTGYANAGSYNPVVKVDDANGLSVTRTFNLTVKDVDPSVKVYTRFSAGDAVGAPWNSITGPVTSNLIDANGNTTAMGVTVTPTWWYATSSAGPTTGNNSGVYPDAVLKDYFYFGSPWTGDVIDVYFWGLDTTKRYNLTFLSSSVWDGATDNGKTNFKVGSQSVTIAVQANTKTTGTLGNLKPAADGTIMVDVTKIAGAPSGIINAMVISQVYDDGTAPAAATNLAAVLGNSNAVTLSWTDVSYNENSYAVYRSVGDTNSYAQIATLGPNTITYIDTPSTGNTVCYYKVKAINSYGASDWSNSATVTTANRIPKFAAQANVTLTNKQTQTITVTAADDPTDHLTLTAVNLPSFVQFTDNGDGTGTINIQPTAGLQGTFGITVKAKDMADSAGSVSFNVSVVDPSLRYTYVNITNPNYTAGAPWNNFIIPYLPYATMNVTNLLDETGTNTGMTATLTDEWDRFYYSGMKRRNGSDVYPENVLYNALTTTSNAAHRITLTGMDVTKKYNILFFASHSTSEPSNTFYTVNGQTTSLNACMNSNKTVQLNGLTPDNTGKMVISVTKDTASIYGMISAFVIESYDPADTTVFSPADLRVLDYSKTNTIALQWQDRATNETGYEVWRANEGGTYSLITTLPAGSTSYLDSALAPNKVFNYVVRAKTATGYSAYSIPVKGRTYTNTVFVNFNGSTVAAAGTPWNSLSWLYRSTGNVWTNFKDDAGFTTNLGVTQIDNWDEVETNGYVVGNATGNFPKVPGIFPDKAVVQGFLNFIGNTSNIMITGLDQTKLYDFTLFGSCADDNTQNSTSMYTINGKTSLLNAHFNNSGTVTMFGIQPDAFGNVNINVTAFDSSNSSFSLLTALILKGYTPSSVGVSPAPTTTTKATTTALSLVSSQLQVDTATTDPNGKVSIYPNPFNTFFNLTVPAKDNDNVLVQVTNSSGQTVYNKLYENLTQGTNVLRIEPGSSLTPGVYFVKVIYTKRNEVKVLRVLKNR